MSFRMLINATGSIPFYLNRVTEEAGLWQPSPVFSVNVPLGISHAQNFSITALGSLPQAIYPAWVQAIEKLLIRFRTNRSCRTGPLPPPNLGLI
ncbi:hypothetical protein M407DRAFT_245353, partial [Tulasnella calospora MUT 4182]